MNFIISKDFAGEDNISIKKDLIHILCENGYSIKYIERNEILLEKKLKFPQKGSTSLYLDLFIPIRRIKVLEINKMDEKIIRLKMYPQFYLIISLIIGILVSLAINESYQLNTASYLLISIGIALLIFCIGVISAKKELFSKLDKLI